MTDPGIPPPAIETLIAQLREQAEAIVRDQSLLCRGIVEDATPYCACAPVGTPLCGPCQTLADAIADALTASATREQALREECDKWKADFHAAHTMYDDMTQERDEAIAHDRQPYPTVDAYERVCAVLAEHKTRLQQLEQERKQQPTPVLDSLHAVMTNHGIASRASEYESLITELVQWAAKACRQSQDTRFRQSQLEYDEAVHVNRMLIDGVTDATVDAFLEKQQTYQQRAEHAEARLQQLQEALDKESAREDTRVQRAHENDKPGVRHCPFCGTDSLGYSRDGVLLDFIECHRCGHAFKVRICAIVNPLPAPPEAR